MQRVKITALETFTGAADAYGITDTLYRAGQEYEVHESLANLFIEGKLAAPVAAQDESDDTEEEDEPTLKRRNKGKKRVDWEE